MKHVVEYHFLMKWKLCILFFLLPSLVFAKDNITVTGKVLESQGFHNPVPFATIRVLEVADSTIVALASADKYIYDEYITGSDNQKRYTGEFSIDLPREEGKYIFAVSSIGYEPAFMNVDLTQLGKREYLFQLGTIYLATASKQLDEVTVKASKVKFYNKGDTLVYNADAFKLAEGSMLDALIQQMPGVELKDDGGIYVGGKYVDELLLNGRRFFDNNKQLMLQNLAAYTVKNIEVYNKRGMASELAGADLGDSQYVMDVKLKKEFMAGSSINIEGGYGSEDRYLGRLFAMMFTPKGQYAAYFNINNLNDSRKPGQQTSWTPEKMPTGVRKTISGGFDYNVKTLDNRWELNGNINGETARETDGTDVVRNNYLVTGSTYDYQFNRSRNKSWSLNTKHKIYYKTPKGYGIAAEPFFNYRNWDNYSEDINATFNESFNNVTTDFVRHIYDGNSNGALKSLINRNLTLNRQDGHALSTGMNLWQGIRMPGTNDLLVVNLIGKYNNRHDERFNRYEINYGQDAVPAQTVNRYFKNNPDFNSNLAAEVSYSRTLARSMVLTLSYRYDHLYQKAASDLFLLESLESADDFLFGKMPSVFDYEASLDRNNSYLRREMDNNHRITVGYSYATQNLHIQYNLPVTLKQQQLDYERGRTDTAFTRKSVVFDIGEALFDWRKGNHRLIWSWGLKSQTPDLVTMVNFTDDTDPLYITKGNPDLKNALQFNTRLQYRLTNRETRSRMAIEGRYSVLSNALSQGYTYDTRTGIREASYYNVNGNWSAGGRIAYGQPIGGGLISNLFAALHTTNVDLVGQDSPQLTRSKIYNWNFSDEFRAEYRFGKHQIGLNVTAQHDRFTSNRTDFSQQNTWTVQSGLNAVFELPANFQLATDFTVYNRRGYTDARLNTDNFVWNARLTYRALKGKLLLMLDGYDILHDLSNVSYTINAQARTETYRTVLPRYVMFHAQWRFNSQPKGKK